MTRVHPSRLINMDETAIFFDSAPTRSIARKGAKCIHMCESSSSTVRCTVLLSITASGEKLPPLIIFKGTTTGRIATRELSEPGRYPSRQHHICQPNAWNDQNGMNEWIEKVGTKTNIGICHLLTV